MNGVSDMHVLLKHTTLIFRITTSHIQQCYWFRKQYL